MENVIKILNPKVKYIFIPIYSKEQTKIFKLITSIKVYLINPNICDMFIYVF